MKTRLESEMDRLFPTQNDADGNPHIREIDGRLILGDTVGSGEIPRELADGLAEQLATIDTDADDGYDRAWDVLGSAVVDGTW
jgi:hypothetical protein